MIIIGSYPDQIQGTIEKLDSFLSKYFPDDIHLHLMPFQESCGDGGFAINNWYNVESSFGSWSDIRLLSQKRAVLVDGVFNHVGVGHPWFQLLKEYPTEYKEMFYTNINNGLKSPRGQLADTKISTADGVIYVRQTHMNKTVDINLENKKVLNEIEQYLEFLKQNGIWGIRLDAVAYYKKGIAISHNEGSFELANRIANLVINKGFFVMAQADCDEKGRVFFSDKEHKGIAIYDFSYAAFLCSALISGNPTDLVEHLLKTSSFNRILIRAPRTHDGILLRGGNLTRNCIVTIENFAKLYNIPVRYTQGKIYELNCSLPYLYKKIYKDLKKVLLMSIVFTGIIKSIPYYYLPYLLGAIPEEFSEDERVPERFSVDDPRTLNRKPIWSFNNQDIPYIEKVSAIIIKLNELHNIFKDEILYGNDNYEIKDGLVRTSIANGKIIGYFNFSSNIYADSSINTDGYTLYMSSNNNHNEYGAYDYKIYVLQSNERMYENMKKIVALDIGASSIKAGIVTKKGAYYDTIIDEERVQLETNEFSELKAKVIEICRRKFEQGAERIVGISTAGSVDNNGIVISAGNFKNYCNIYWQEILSEIFGETIAETVNDGRASAWGEYITSNERANTHVHAVVGTGIGGGVIHNGDLLKGDSGQAGYIGHIKVTPLDTPICSCGKMGCVESLASARGIAAIYSKKNGHEHSFDEMMKNADTDTQNVMKAFIEGGYWLGVALGNVMNVINPQCVTIGGGVILAVQELMDTYKLASNPYLEGVREGVHYASHRRVEATGNVMCGVLGNYAGIIGAANLVAKKAYLLD